VVIVKSRKNGASVGLDDPLLRIRNQFSADGDDACVIDAYVRASFAFYLGIPNEHHRLATVWRALGCITG
jgi:hypothetical protein